MTLTTQQGTLVCAATQQLHPVPRRSQTTVVPPELLQRSFIQHNEHDYQRWRNATDESRPAALARQACMCLYKPADSHVECLYVVSMYVREYHSCLPKHFACHHSYQRVVIAVSPALQPLSPLAACTQLSVGTGLLACKQTALMTIALLRCR